jgi:hypothetical protein
MTRCTVGSSSSMDKNYFQKVKADQKRLDQEGKLNDLELDFSQEMTLRVNQMAKDYDVSPSDIVVGVMKEMIKVYEKEES